MIPAYLLEKLKDLFDIVDLTLNTDGQLSLSEWEIEKDGTPEIVDMINYDEYIFKINAIFKEDDFQEILDDEDATFFKAIKDSFVMISRNTGEVEQGRIKLEMVLRQAVMTC